METPPRLGSTTLPAAAARLARGRARLVRWVRARRLPFFLALCVVTAAGSWTLAFLVRFDLSSVDRFRVPWHGLWRDTIGLAIVCRAAGCALLQLHRLSWRYAAASDLLRLLVAVAAGTALLGLVLAGFGPPLVPRGILVIDALVSLTLLSILRYAWRLGGELLAALGMSGRRRVVVIGGGEAGLLTVRAMASPGLAEWRPVAILDDDPGKQGTMLMGVPVVGPVALVADVVRRSRAEAIVLAVPTATSSQLYRIVRHCRAAGVPLKTIPDVGQILRSERAVDRISDFRVEDLLRRRPRAADVPEIRGLLRGRVVLVTGAAGSIGSELCRQIAEQGARRLVCLDRDENGLFRLEHELRATAPAGAALEFWLGDARDARRLAALFDAHAPEVVFHAAAYKHVPVLQHHPLEAIRNNVGGTLNLAELADRRGVETFVLISTDKAVNPTSVMGATKRACEHIVRARSRTSRTRFCAIRFGNVLGSNGSVVELFLRQIREGRPVTVTHPRMERYFMTIGEAVHLVLFAGAMAEGGETFILDMGDPVGIDQLARQMIQLAGLVPDVDVPVVYTGLRPGEKLSEELWTATERPRPTAHPGILVAPRGDVRVPDLEARVRALLAAAERGDGPACRDGLLALVPTFRGVWEGELSPAAGVAAGAQAQAAGTPA